MKPGGSRMCRGSQQLNKQRWVPRRIEKAPCILSSCRMIGRLHASVEQRWNRMPGDTILYIRDHGPRSSSILAALEAIGYEVVSTNSSAQAIALLFVMHSVTAVVLDQHSIEQPSFDLTHSLRALRPDVPRILLCADRIDRLPPAVDYCVNAGQPLDNVTSDLQRILAEKPAPVSAVDCCSGARPST